MLGSQNTLSTSIWLARAAPAVGPYPETTFRTPFGRPACPMGENYKIQIISGSTNINEMVIRTKRL